MINHLFSGDLRSARETAERFLLAAESKTRPTEIAAGASLLGLTFITQGDFAKAGTLRTDAPNLRPERDREAKSVSQ